jgi:hypothetical protein
LYFAKQPDDTINMAGLLKRFRHGETDTTDAVVSSPQDSNSGSALPPDNNEKDSGVSSARDIQEAETNRKLAVFERAHRWDPNLDDEQLLEIDNVVNAGDANSGARVFEEIFENSPYPEVYPVPFSFWISGLSTWVDSIPCTEYHTGSRSCPEL